MIEAGCFLFGSLARGDADAASDTDVLIVYGCEPSFSDRKQIKRSIMEQLQRECAFAEYARERLVSMFDEGHLFAWHLHHEAKILRIFGSGSMASSFPRPAIYRSSRVDVLNFIELLLSCTRKFEISPNSVVYEAGLAYLAIRNIGMSLSVAALSRPVFGRYVPFDVSRALHISPPCDVEIYNLLVAARHSSQRGLDAPDLDVKLLLSSLMGACDWARSALEIANEFTPA